MKGLVRTYASRASFSPPSAPPAWAEERLQVPRAFPVAMAATEAIRVTRKWLSDLRSAGAAPPPCHSSLCPAPAAQALV